MAVEMRKLLTVITEASIERQLIKDFQQWGVTGYTITDARGKGSRGVRDAGWDVSANIRIEIVCNDVLAHQVADNMRKKYYDNYAMITYIADVEVMRSEKF